MNDARPLGFIYALFLGILIALFVGVGINTFYSGPKPPEFPLALNSTGKELTDAELKIQQNYDKKIAAHNNAMKPYNRNVSMLALGAAVLLLLVSIYFEKHIKLLSNGVLTGGLLSLLYSIGRGFASENSKYLFALVTVALALVLYTGYKHFVSKPAAAA